MRQKCKAGKTRNDRETVNKEWTDEKMGEICREITHETKEKQPDIGRRNIGGKVKERKR